MSVTTRTRRTLAVCLAAATGLSALTACSSSSGGGGGASAGKTEITFSYLWGGPEGQALEKLVTKFNGSQDKIVVKGVSAPDMQKQLTSMSGKNAAFDISDNFGNAVGSWASKGILAPLDEEIAKAKIDTGDFVPAAMDQMKHQGKTYSMPIAVHTFALYYNKKMLAEAGITPPTTTAELAAAIAKLTQVDAAGNITRLGMGDPDSPTTLTTLAYAFGGTWDGTEAAKPTPTPTEAGNVAALQWWQDSVVTKYGADKLSKFKAGWGQYMSAQDPFYTGKVAMIIDGEWQAVSIPKTVPGFEYGVVPIPVGPGGQAGATQLTASTLFIPSNSSHKAEAAQFLAFLLAKEQMLEFDKALGNLPARTSLADPANFSGISGFDVFLSSLKSPQLKALSSAPYSSQYATDMGAAFDSVNSGKASAKEALEKLAGQAKAYAQ